MEAIPCLRKGGSWGLKISTLSTGLSSEKKRILRIDGQAEVGSISSDLCPCSLANKFSHQLVV